jgi:hypothetical protein
MKPVAAGLPEGRIEYDLPPRPLLHAAPDAAPGELDPFALNELKLAADILQRHLGFSIGGFERVAEIRSKYAGVPDRVSPGVWGAHDLEFVRLGDMRTIAQVRKERNPQFFNIAQSLMPELDGRNRNLQNLPDLVIIGADLFSRFVDFTNRLYGLEDSADNYPEVDGVHHLVAAGHTRKAGMVFDETLLSELAAAEGYATDPDDSVVLVKAYRIQTPEDILDIQINENLHSKPSKEEEAEAMVGTYLWGKEIGKWHTAEEFVEVLGDKFPVDMLMDVVAFSELCPEARQHLVEKKLKYAPAVILGRAVPAYREYLLFKDFHDVSFEELSEADQVRVTERVRSWTMGEVGSLERIKPTITQARSIYCDYIGSWEMVVGRPLREIDPELEKRRKRVSQLQGDMFGDQMTDDEKHEIEMRRLRKAWRDQVRRMLERSYRDSAVAKLHVEQLGMFSEEAGYLRERVQTMVQGMSSSIWGRILDQEL